jgi:SNF family Na+-dependent transporter
MPVIFQDIAFGQVFGAIWFSLLFIAALTTSVALSSPVIAFFQDEFNWSHSKAVNITFIFLVTAIIPIVLFLKYGFLDELDFWAGTFLLALFAIIEIIIFSWVFGMKKGWAEINKGADIRLPRIFRFAMKYITPLYLLVILGAWTYQDAIGSFFMKELTRRAVFMLLRREV